MRAGWHLYARPEGALAALALRAAPSSGYEPGELVLPADEDGRLTRRFALHVPLRRRAPGEGLAFELSFQACDADSCRPVESVRLAR